MKAAPQKATIESLLAETEWLRRLAHRLIPDSHRADDLAQETMLSALRYRPRAEQGPRPWLSRVAKNLAGKLRRREENRRRREHAAARPEAVPSVAESIEGFSTHGAVVNAVLALDEPYRATLLLRYWEDLPPAEVARRMDVPTETVRTRLRRGLERLRSRLDRDCGSRSAWVLPLLELRGRGPAPAALEGTVIGGTTLTKKTASVAALLVLGAATLWLITSDAFQSGARQVEPNLAGERQGEATEAERDRTRQEDRVAAREPARRDQATEKNTLEVRVRFADGRPAPNVGVYVRPGIRGLGQTTRTDERGLAQFAEIAPGRWLVDLDRCDGRRVDVHGPTQCTIEIPVGVRVVGRVLDLEKNPIAGARVYAADQAHHDLAHFLATTDALGQYELRDVAPGTALLARKEGWQRSRGRRDRVRAQAGKEDRIDLTLGARAYEVFGRVLAPDGQPAPHAVVLFAVDEDARKKIDGIEEVRKQDGNRRLDREAIVVRADARGRFRTHEVPWGDVSVLVRGFGEQANLIATKMTRVARDARNEITVQLRNGARLFGTVTDENGQPIAGVTLDFAWEGTDEVGEIEHEFGRALLNRACTSRPDGSYEAAGLFEGHYDINRRLEPRSQKLREVELTPQQQLRLNLEAERTWKLQVRVLDENEAPLRGWAVGLATHGTLRFGLLHRSRTNDAGVFLARDLRSDRYQLSLHRPDSGTFQRMPSHLGVVSRGTKELTIRLSGKRALSGIRGQLCDATGRPIRKGHLELRRGDFGEEQDLRIANDGSFAAEGLAPGRYSLHPEGVRTAPRVPIGTWTLRAGEPLDLGVVTLKQAVRLHLDVRDAGGAAVHKPDGWLVGATARFSLDRTRKPGELRSPLVPAGRYRLTVGGRGVAAVHESVELAASDERRTVTCAAGQRRNVEVRFPGPRNGEVHALIEFFDRDERLVATRYVEQTLPRNLLLTTTVTLVAGAYRATASARRSSGEASFRIEAGDSAPIRIQLRQTR